MRIKKVSESILPEGHIIDSLEVASSTNAPSINAVKKVIDYSLEEVNTGAKWIDGKDIYRKVLVDVAPNKGSLDRKLSFDEQISTLVNITGNVKDPDSTSIYPIVFGLGDGKVQVYLINITDKTIWTFWDCSEAGETLTIVMEYTKTTD